MKDVITLLIVIAVVTPPCAYLFGFCLAWGWHHARAWQLSRMLDDKDNP